jgi:hypothetical protein
VGLNAVSGQRHRASNAKQATRLTYKPGAIAQSHRALSGVYVAERRMQWSI